MQSCSQNSLPTYDLGSLFSADAPYLLSCLLPFFRCWLPPSMAVCTGNTPTLSKGHTAKPQLVLGDFSLSCTHVFHFTHTVSCDKLFVNFNIRICLTLKKAFENLSPPQKNSKPRRFFCEIAFSFLFNVIQYVIQDPKSCQFLCYDNLLKHPILFCFFPSCCHSHSSLSQKKMSEYINYNLLDLHIVNAIEKIKSLGK